MFDWETRGERQAEFVKLIKSKDIVFGFGPSGTGKSFLAANMAVEFLKKNRGSEIIFTKPLVQVDGDLGFLPGDLEEKTAPYKQVLDEFFQEALNEQYQKLISEERVKFSCLEFMRGKTFSNAFVILDEAQNCTVNQTKMFLTRLGKNSKMVILGDLNQSDIGDLCLNGLSDALHKFNLPHWYADMGFVKFRIEDIQRHGIVGKIVREYEK
jgi:phosphate starvation-inducible PhoH-like protein